MRYRSFYLFVFVFSLLCSSTMTAQNCEPDFIGEAYLVDKQDECKQLDKEIAAYTRGMSWKANSWDALSLEIVGGKAQTRILTGEPIKIIVRAADNNSDPLSIISIYHLRSKKKKRTTILSENNSGTLMKSRTHTKNQLLYTGKRYGNSSYVLAVGNIEPGEYGIVVFNPNSIDEKRVVVSCFGVD